LRRREAECLRARAHGRPKHRFTRPFLPADTNVRLSLVAQGQAGTP
jgi:hypothetical protein